MSKLAEILKTKLVAAELRAMGITEKETVLAVAARVEVRETGQLVGLDKDGLSVGSGPDHYMTVGDVVRDMGLTADPAPAPTAPRVVIDPSAPSFNLSAAFAAARTDPDLYAELLRSLAPRPFAPGVLR